MSLLKLDNLYCGDCLELMPNIAEHSIDAIICDLPYGVTKNHWDSIIPLNDYIEVKKRNKNIMLDYNSYMLESFKNGLTYSNALEQWNINHKKGLWSNYDRILKENGVVILFSDGMFMADVMKSNEKNWKYNIVWDKLLTTGFLNSNKQPLRQHEEVVIFYKKQPTYNPQKKKGKLNHSKGKTQKNTNNNYGEFKIVDNKDKLGDMKFPTSIWQYQKVHPSKSVHPTEKPVEILLELIRTYTNEGDIILDNTMGSGSTIKACILENRHFIGIEKDEEIFKKTQQSITEMLQWR